MGHIKYILTLLLVGAFAALAGCQSGPAAQPDTGPTAVTGVYEEVDLSEYKLGAGDRISVTVFDEPTLSGEMAVDGSGVVSMPLVGEIEAEGLTVREFQAAYKDALEPDYLLNARVSVEVETFRPYYILGEVNTPGEYEYIEDLTLIAAVAKAGNWSYRANRRHVFVRPLGGETEIRVEVTPNTKVNPGDTIRVVERLF